MKTMIKAFFTLFFIIWTYPGFCAPGDSIVVKLTIQKKEISHIDNLPTLSMDTVFYNQDRQLSLPHYILYHYSQGEYRIRVLCRFSMFNKLKDRYSNWTYFACNKDIDEK